MVERLLDKATYIRLHVAASELEELAKVVPELTPHYKAVESIANAVKVKL